MIVLVLGGTRSGKSALAERLLAGMAAPFTYVATASFDADDEDMLERVERHRQRRPTEWASVESSTDLVQTLRSITGSVLVDALGTWVASTNTMAVDIKSLCLALRERSGDTVLVSDEVGMGVHPSTEIGRRFRDVLGEVNQAVAEIADHVFLVVAGRVLKLHPFDSIDALGGHLEASGS
ncbi:MAG: bifunctional adenosylcobinamide kinase/adenosylcobinamide-phosphate guanylyltransferase [Acidimicrobiales bacterium]